MRRRQRQHGNERDSLQDQINALQTAYGADDLTPAGITQLQTDLGTAQTALEAATAGLAAATAEVMGLQTEVEGLMATLGDETDPDAGSVRGMLAAKIAELSTAMDALTAAQDQVTQLTADLAAANARIVALVAGTDEEQLTPVETGANAASDAAATAATAAGAAAAAAEAAMANRATMQTGDANSIADAYAARAAATTAMEEAAKRLLPPPQRRVRAMLLPRPLSRRRPLPPRRRLRLLRPPPKPPRPTLRRMRLRS